MRCPEPRCCGKVLHADKGAAPRQVRRAVQTARYATEGRELQAYRCPAGHGWHVGQKVREGVA